VVWLRMSDGSSGGADTLGNSAGLVGGLRGVVRMTGSFDSRTCHQMFVWLGFSSFATVFL